MGSFNILVIPGDGVGPEVMKEALKVLKVVEEASGTTFNLEHEIVGQKSLDERGDRITPEVIEKGKKADAILFGSEGGNDQDPAPRGPGIAGGLLRLRKALDIYANLRPCSVVSKSLHYLSPLKPELVEGTDILLIRENTGGAYFGQKVEEESFASDTWAYHESEVARVARVAGAIARSHNPPLQVTSVDKANVLASMRLWRRTVIKVFAKEFPDIKLVHQLVDSGAMLMMKQPKKFNGIVLTENTFGDILSDELSVIPGSLGLLPSGSLSGVPGEKGVKGLYEPIHGTAPDIAGKGIVNPIAQILSVEMMIRYSCDMAKEADAIKQAVSKVLDSKSDGGLEIRTGDLGGKASTTEVGDAVCSELKKILSK